MPFRSSARGAYGPQGIKIIKGPLPPVWVTSGALPTATTAPYSQQLSATDDSGDNPLYSLESGSLPTGLTLSPAGLIAGTATGASTTYSFTVRATDVNGRSSVSNTLTIQTILIVNGFPSQSPSGMTTTTDNGKFVAYRTSQGDSTISVVAGGEIIMALVGSNGSNIASGSSSCSRAGGYGGRGGMSIVRFTVPSGVSSLLLSVGGAGASGTSGGPFAGGYNGGASSGSWYGGGGQFGSGYQAGAGGGGYTGVFVSSKSQANTYLMVGGGGGSGQNGADPNRGAGGGLNGNGTSDSGNSAATPTSPGLFTAGAQYYNQVGGSGSALQGGTGANSWLDQGGGGGGGYFGGGGGEGGGGCSGGYGGGGSGKIQTVSVSSYYNYTDIGSLKSGLATYYGLTGNVIPGTCGTSLNAGGIFVWAVI